MHCPARFSLFAAHFWLVTLAVKLTACGDAAPATTTADIAPADAASTCAAPQLRPDGTCCPPGHAFDPADHACVAVGPRACAAHLPGDPSACVPRWCHNWKDGQGADCKPGELGCLPTPRSCTDVEQAASMGCSAGHFPDGDPGACRPAGLVSVPPARARNADPTATLPPLHAPVGVPPLESLPPIDQTRFCVAADGKSVAACQPGQEGCPAGQAPAPTAPGTCVAVGAGWLCPAGFAAAAHAAGTDAVLAPCAPDPAACGSDAFGGVEEGPGVVFVDPLAVGKADGSKGAPFASLATAIAAVPEGGTVALAAGEHSGPLQISKGITLHGRCAAKVSLVAKGGVPALTIKAAGSGAPVVVRGLRFAPTAYGLAVLGTRPVQAQALMFDRVLKWAVVASGAGTSLTLTDSAIVGTQPSSGALGTALLAEKGGNLTARRVRATDGRSYGANVTGASTLVLDDVLLDSTRPGPDQKAQGGGYGVAAVGASVVSLQSVRLFDHRLAGLIVQGAGTKATLYGVVIDGTRGLPGLLTGGGVFAGTGSQVELTASRMHDNEGTGVAVVGAGATVTARAVVVDATLSQSKTGEGGQGLWVGQGGSAQVVASRFSHNREAAMGVFGGKLALLQVLVDDTQPRIADGTHGTGVFVNGSANAELDRVHIHGSRGNGLAIGDAASVVLARDVLVDGTADGIVAASRGAGVAMGVGVYCGGSLRWFGGRVTGSSGLGVVSTGAGVAELAGVLVDSPAKGAATGGGMGVAAAFGATVRLAGCRLAHNRVAGGVATEAGARLDAQGVLVDHTLPGQEGAGYGFAVSKGGELEAAAALVVHALGAGVFVHASTARLTDCAVRDVAFSTVQVFGAQPVKLGAGIAAYDGREFAVQRVSVASIGSAGILLQDCVNATVTETVVSGGLYGLVNEGKTTTTTKHNAVFGNTLANRSGSQGLSVPPPPTLVLPGSAN